MKLLNTKRWKMITHGSYKRYKSRTMKSSRKRRDLSGKYVILINNKDSKKAAILKFVNRRTCELKAAVNVNKAILKQTSSRFIINARRRKRLIKRIEVIGSSGRFKRMKEQYEQLYSKKEIPKKVVTPMKVKEQELVQEPEKSLVKSKENGVLSTTIMTSANNIVTMTTTTTTVVGDGIVTSPKIRTEVHKKVLRLNVAPHLKKISPIKIYNCKKCSHKFTTKKFFDKHMEVHKEQESSGSEADLVIDDDVELVLEGESSDNSVVVPSITHNLKKEVMSSEQKTVKQVSLPCNDDKSPMEGNESEEESLLVELNDQHACQKKNCGARFDSAVELTEHERIKHKSLGKTFKCNKCSDSYSRESSLLAHQKMNHPVGIIEPKPTKAIMRARRESICLSRYRKAMTSLGKRKIPAPTPPITFKKTVTESKKFVCSVCSSSFPERRFLDRHVSIHHIKKLYLCSKCAQPFDPMKLMTHWKQCDREERNAAAKVDINSESVHRCPFCIYDSTFRSNVETHMTFEHYDDFEKNSDSEKAESSPDSLENLALPETAKAIDEMQREAENQQRRRINDPSFKFRCVRCERRFASKDGLNIHSCRSKELTKPLPYKPSAPNPMNPIEAMLAARREQAQMNAQMRITTKTPLVNGFFRCLSCPQVFTNRGIYNAHLKDKHQVKDSDCP